MKDKLIKRTYRIYKSQDKRVKRAAKTEVSESGVIRKLIEQLPNY